MSKVEIGERVKDSPMGAGVLTGITERGMPQINHVAVAWIETEDGGIFDPFGVRDKHIKSSRPAMSATPPATE